MSIENRNHRDKNTRSNRTSNTLRCAPSEVELWGVCYDIQNTTTLNLSNSGLTGEIPSEIGNLTNLTDLILFNNQLTGEIPSEIGNLTNLILLRLSSNQLTGEIPPEIGNLTNLINLSINNNQLTGEIPPEIWNLNLTVLILYGNQLTGEIPPEIGNLTNLTVLHLNNNQLTGEIPEEICNQGDSSPSLHNNQLCPPYPECVDVPVLQPQDTSGCYESSYKPCFDHIDCNPGEYCHSGWNGTEYGKRFCIYAGTASEGAIQPYTDYCSNNPCGLGDGDCDDDSDCDAPGLICGTDNCPFDGVNGIPLIEIETICKPSCTERNKPMTEDMNTPGYVFWPAKCE